MPKKRLKIYLWLLLFIAIIWLPKITFAGTANFSYNPTTVNVNPGQEFTVESKVTLTDQAADTFNLEVLFPSNLVTFKSHEENNKCSYGAPDETKDGSVVIVRGCAGEANVVQNETFLITTLKFAAIGSGTAKITYGSQTTAYKEGLKVASSSGGSSTVNIAVTGNNGTGTTTTTTNTNTGTTGNKTPNQGTGTQTGTTSNQSTGTTGGVTPQDVNNDGKVETDTNRDGILDENDVVETNPFTVFVNGLKNYQTLLWLIPVLIIAIIADIYLIRHLKRH
jgi:hypothetical protein